MIILAIDRIPNQTFTSVLDSARFVVTLKETRGVMSATVVRDDIPVIEGARICAGTPLLPYQYKERGNFFLLTQNDDLPDYTKFGISQILVYLTAAEVEIYRGAN